MTMRLQGREGPNPMNEISPNTLDELAEVLRGNTCLRRLSLHLADKQFGDVAVDQLVEEVADATGSDVASVRSAARQIMHGSWASDIIGPVAA